MGKENWLKKASTTKRFWGAVVTVVGGVLLVFPPTTAIGTIMLPAGLGTLLSGGVDNAKRKADAKGKDSVEDSGSSDQK